MSSEVEVWQTATAELTFPSDRIDVWRVCLVHCEQSEQDLRGILTLDEVAHASRYHFEEDRRRYIRGRAALRMLLGRYLETPPADIRFQYENNGKPEIALPRDSRGLRFSVSDSCGLALIAVGSGSAIGVDIEKVRPLPDFLDIATRFFPAREVQAILALSENKRQEAFFACWTRKEAYLKATGIGLLRPLSEFSVSVDPDGPAELWEVKGDPDAVTHWSLESVRPGAGYMGALAYKGPVRRVKWLCQADCPLPADIV
jgi:4'-phosphopantetheinyl transferase